MSTPSPPDEAPRLEALSDHRPLGPRVQDLLDDLVEVAAEVCDVPFAAVLLVGADEQETVATTGPDLDVLRDEGFSGHVIEDAGVLVVEDAAEDERFRDVPYVRDDPRVRFYAGAPVEDADGHRLGTVSVMDDEPRHVDESTRRDLARLGRQAGAILEMGRRGDEVAALSEVLDDQQEELSELAHVATHQLEGPLEDVVRNAEVVRDRLEGEVDHETVSRLDHVRDQGEALSAVVDSIEDYLRATADVPGGGGGPVRLAVCYDEVVDGLSRTRGHDTTRLHRDGDAVVDVPREDLALVLKHLLANGLAYSDDGAPVTVTAEETDDAVRIRVADEGPGMSEADVQRLRQPFQRGHKWGDVPGAGVGLALCERVLGRHGADLVFETGPGEGTTVSFTLPRTEAPETGPGGPSEPAGPPEPPEPPEFPESPGSADSPF